MNDSKRRQEGSLPLRWLSSATLVAEVGTGVVLALPVDEIDPDKHITLEKLFISSPWAKEEEYDD